MSGKEFEALFKKHFKGLSFFALEYVKDHDQAREIVQEAFAALWERRGTIRPGWSPGSYMATSVKNRCLNHLRDNKKFDHSILEFEGLDRQEDFRADDPLVSGELQVKIEHAIASLPEKCREIFILNRYEHKKYNRIAEELNISVKTVEAQMTKALKVMREKLAEFLGLLLLLLGFLFGA